MLTEERYAGILKILQERRTVGVQELTALLDASESTIRRDLTALHNQGRLLKVHGGATLLQPLGAYSARDDDVAVRQDLNVEEKRRIARRAAAMIGKNDFVYIDAGTTTGLMIDHIDEQHAVFVTNGTVHAKRLARRGLRTIILGGELKTATEAVVGAEAIAALAKYNFTKGFFGANGVNTNTGYSTPDVAEAMVKAEAMARCRSCYVLADSSKLGAVSPVTFAKLFQASVITTRLTLPELRGETTILEVDRE